MTKPACANTQHKRIAGLDSVEASDGRPAIVVWQYYVRSRSGRPLTRRRALCSRCIAGHDWAWHQRYAASEGFPLGRIVAIGDDPIALHLVATRPETP